MQPLQTKTPFITLQLDNRVVIGICLILALDKQVSVMWELGRSWGSGTLIEIDGRR